MAERGDDGIRTAGARPHGRRPDSAHPRNNGVRAISDLVGKAGGAAFRRFGFVQHAIVTRWGEIVGQRYAAVTAPESIRFPHGQKSGGTLSLVVAGAHAPMIQHVTPTIIDRVNRFFGYPAIERVTVRQGRVEPLAAATTAPSRPTLVAPDLSDSLRAVSDPELHAVLEALARGLSAGDGKPAITAIPVVGRIGG